MKNVICRNFLWSIGTKERIPVWDHPWLCKAAHILTTCWLHLKSNGILGLVNVFFFFYNNTTSNIVNTVLLPSLIHDVATLKLERDGVYTVKSAYKDIMNHDMTTLQHRVLGNGNCVWNIKNFLWRACRNCLPTRIRLQTKCVQCPDHCAVCEDYGEDSTHLFFICSKSVLC